MQDVHGSTGNRTTSNVCSCMHGYKYLSACMAHYIHYYFQVIRFCYYFFCDYFGLVKMYHIIQFFQMHLITISPFHSNNKKNPLSTK